MGKRGNKLRPCVRCAQVVKFVPWEERRYAERRNIWHWVNENGEHHRCSETQNALDEQAKEHIRAIAEA